MRFRDKQEQIWAPHSPRTVQIFAMALGKEICGEGEQREAYHKTEEGPRMHVGLAR